MTTEELQQRIDRLRAMQGKLHCLAADMEFASQDFLTEAKSFGREIAKLEIALEEIKAAEAE